MRIIRACSSSRAAITRSRLKSVKPSMGEEDVRTMRRLSSRARSAAMSSGACAPDLRQRRPLRRCRARFLRVSAEGGGSCRRPRKADADILTAAAQIVRAHRKRVFQRHRVAEIHASDGGTAFSMRIPSYNSLHYICIHIINSTTVIESIADFEFFDFAAFMLI